ncbi:MAG: aspartate--tRNA(Asn) ligase [Bacillota bacterium]|nr:aspartate--tRNA(Asn) ligase [Bacillota bacterium]
MKRTLCSDISRHQGEEIRICGWVQATRSLGGIAFVIVRDRTGTSQAVFEGKAELPPQQSVVEVSGMVRAEKRAPGGCEIVGTCITELSRAEPALPLDIMGKTQSNVEVMLDHRVLALRNPRVSAALRVQSELAAAFRDFLRSEGFTEVFTPKIVATGTEGGAELFEVKYFERQAYLAQSPQLYKQMLVGSGLERVFEVGPVFRAEEHNTSRHINQFTSLDLEMGFIESVEDVMRLEERLLAYALPRVAKACACEIEMAGARVPQPGSIPRLDIEEAREAARIGLGHEMPPGNLSPEGEKAVSEHILETTGQEFVFVTGYPVTSRPFYAMPDPTDPSRTKSFDLLFRGLEVTTGGQRIHDHEMLLRNLSAWGLDPAKFEGYLEVFRFGMPPHGGLAIGAERLTTRLLGLGNVREACTFPRDRTRLQP